MADVRLVLYYLHRNKTQMRSVYPRKLPRCSLFLAFPREAAPYHIAPTLAAKLRWCGGGRNAAKTASVVVSMVLCQIH